MTARGRNALPPAIVDAIRREVSAQLSGDEAPAEPSRRELRCAQCGSVASKEEAVLVCASRADVSHDGSLCFTREERIACGQVCAGALKAEAEQRLRIGTHAPGGVL